MSDRIEQFAAEYAARLQCKDQSDDLEREAFVRTDRFLEVRASEIWLFLVADVERGVSVFNSNSQGARRVVEWGFSPVKNQFTVKQGQPPQSELTVTFEPPTHAINYNLAAQPSVEDSLETLSSGRFQLEKSPGGYAAHFTHKGKPMIREDVATFLLSLIFDAISRSTTKKA